MKIFAQQFGFRASKSLDCEGAFPVLYVAGLEARDSSLRYSGENGVLETRWLKIELFVFHLSTSSLSTAAPSTTAHRAFGRDWVMLEKIGVPGQRWTQLETVLARVHCLCRDRLPISFPLTLTFLSFLPGPLFAH